MKIIRFSFIVLASFLLAPGLFAALPHMGLTFKAVSATYNVYDGTEYFDVKWSVVNAYDDFIRGTAFDTHRYTMTINFAAEKTANYSLLTLGAQSMSSDIFIREATAKDDGGNSAVVKFYPSEAATTAISAPTLNGAPLLVLRIPPKDKPIPGFPNHKGPDPDSIWFLSLTKAKSVTLIVEIAGGSVYGVRPGNVAWDVGPPSSEHDNMPPTDPPW